tara:strand:- start:385 stop:756 length:372 start_codon:yes stop_codon:yes gene_type:complete
MKDDGVNRDTTIEVGDLVRVVSDYMHDPHGFMGNDYIVGSIGEDDGAIWLTANDGVEWWFDPEELEIMTPKAELESVLEAERSLEEVKDRCYEYCLRRHAETVLPWNKADYKLNNIFEPRTCN